MEINYNRDHRTIVIQDGLKKVYVILKALMVLNLFNAILFIAVIRETGFGFLEILWLCVAVFSLLVLFFLVFKKSTASELHTDRILRLKEKKIFGKSRYSLELRGGKERDLGKISSEQDVAALRLLMTEAGIPIP